MDQPRIAIIGSGNVATHLAPAFDRVGHVAQVCSRDLEHARVLASRLRSCQAINDIQSLDSTVDFCIITVSDDALPSVAAALPPMSGIVAHTAGSMPMTVLESSACRYGVIYPLQTFSKGAEVKIDEVPFFIEGSDESTTQSLLLLAKSISSSVHKANSEQRSHLHIAAVFGCNFANHLWSLSEQLLADVGYGLEVLRPLLQVTLDKAMSISPASAQTGPAARGDMAVMAKHEAMLPVELRQIYKTLSSSIMLQQKSKSQNKKR